MTIKGNKGEWSEIYALYKILGDKSLHPGNEKIEQIQQVVYPVVSVLRMESDGLFEYSIDQDIVIISSNQVELLRIPVSEFAQQAQNLFTIIKASQNSFAIPEIEEFMAKVHCKALKADSSTKTDITIVVHDEKTNQTPVLGFSIKSQLGSPSTLLNAGRTTNFKYRVSPGILPYVKDINAIATRSKIKDRISKITEHNGTLKFICTEKTVFSNNLILIDSALPQILAEIVYMFFSSNLSRVSDLVQAVEESNPLNYDVSSNHPFYSYKIKKLLTDAALGMMPAKVWTGNYDATGGFLIVKEDGDVLCYHIYNRNEFEDYLFANTKLETASSSKHHFGTVYQDGDQLFMSLNLQIRFIK